jgi:predicted nicotinamide N-methyase
MHCCQCTAANAGKRVLEIGCGPGLVATCVCRSGAGRVLLTDGDPQTLVNCLSNLRMNGHGDGTLLGSWQEAAGFVQGAAAAASDVEGSVCQGAQVGFWGITESSGRGNSLCHGSKSGAQLMA